MRNGHYVRPVSLYEAVLRGYEDALDLLIKGGTIQVVDSIHESIAEHIAEKFTSAVLTASKDGDHRTEEALFNLHAAILSIKPK